LVFYKRFAQAANPDEHHLLVEAKRVLRELVQAGRS
jgi:hypothetical protein